MLFWNIPTFIPIYLFLPSGQTRAYLWADADGRRLLSRDWHLRRGKRLQGQHIRHLPRGHQWACIYHRENLLVYFLFLSSPQIFISLLMHKSAPSKIIVCHYVGIMPPKKTWYYGKHKHFLYFSPPIYRLYAEEDSVYIYFIIIGLWIIIKVAILYEIVYVAGLTTRWQLNTFLHEKSCSKYFLILVMHYHPTQNAVHFSFSGCCSETGPSWSTAGAERYYRHSSGPLVVCQRCHRVQTHLVIIR